jgi:hypothetical protein
MRLIICWLLLPIHDDAKHDSDAATQTGKFLCVSKWHCFFSKQSITIEVSFLDENHVLIIPMG